MQVTVCPKCGMKNSVRARCCASCGTELKGASGAPDFPEETALVTELIPGEEEEEKGKDKKRRLLLILLCLAALLLIALILGILVYLMRGEKQAETPPPAPSFRPAVTAVPAQVSGRNEKLPFSAGATEVPREAPTKAPSPEPTKAPKPTPVPGETESPYFYFGGQRVKKGVTSVDVRGSAGKPVEIPVSEVEDLVYYCPGLTSLVCNYCYFDDYEPLGELTELTKLQLMSCRGHLVRDLSFLEPLTKLNTLNLVNNDVSDVTPLLGLKRLTNLNLGGNTRLGADACEIIGGMAGLRKLYLYSTGIDDVSGLEGLKNLNTLNLRSNEGIEDVSVIEYMPGLKTLQISGTSVRDFSDIAARDGLEELWIDRISLDLANLRKLRRLESLKTLIIGKNDSLTMEKAESALPGVTVKYPD